MFQNSGLWSLGPTNAVIGVSWRYSWVRDVQDNCLTDTHVFGVECSVVIKNMLRDINIYRAYDIYIIFDVRTQTYNPQLLTEFYIF